MCGAQVRRSMCCRCRNGSSDHEVRIIKFCRYASRCSTLSGFILSASWRLDALDVPLHFFMAIVSKLSFTLIIDKTSAVVADRHSLLSTRKAPLHQRRSHECALPTTASLMQCHFTTSAGNALSDNLFLPLVEFVCWGASRLASRVRQRLVKGD